MGHDSVICACESLERGFTGLSSGRAEQAADAVPKRIESVGLERKETNQNAPLRV